MHLHAVLVAISQTIGLKPLGSRPFSSRPLGSQPRGRKSPRSLSAVLFIIAVACALPAFAQSTSPAVAPAGAPKQAQTEPPPEKLSAAEFARLSRELSEEGGYFRSDNFTSNETPYLTVVEKLRELGASGGAYIGVGPEQNFTYIAKVRPRIAFLVDIRRQAIIQHLMYKAIFHLSANRGQFLSRLFSRPLPADAKSKLLANDAPIADLLAHFSQTEADEKLYVANLAEIRRTIEKEFAFPLSEKDVTSLEYVYKSFRNEGLEIAYRMDGASGGFGGGRGYFPSFKEIILQTDLNGKLGNFLASVDDYEFVRGLHRKNLIIPVVGDFSGTKALAGVAEYLRRHGFTVTTFYTSNVEQYLFGSDSFSGFVANVRKLPLNERSLFIRSASGRPSHPARLPNHRSATLLQKISVFLEDYDKGLYSTYYNLLTTHYIAPEQP